MFKLYYLADQTDALDGVKTLQGSYPDLASAEAKAVSDGVAHYSVEQDQGDGAIFEIVVCV